MNLKNNKYFVLHTFFISEKCTFKISHLFLTFYFDPFSVSDVVLFDAINFDDETFMSDDLVEIPIKHDFDDVKLDELNEQDNTPAFEFVLSNAGHPQLLFDKHIFNRNNVINSKVYWRCSHSRRLNCKARLVTTATSIAPSHVVHNHEPMRRLIYGMGINSKRNLSRNKKK